MIWSVVQTFKRSPSLRLSTPFFTIRLIGALKYLRFFSCTFRSPWDSLIALRSVFYILGSQSDWLPPGMKGFPGMNHLLVPPTFPSPLLTSPTSPRRYHLHQTPNFWHHWTQPVGKLWTSSTVLKWHDIILDFHRLLIMSAKGITGHKPYTIIFLFSTLTENTSL